MAFGGRRMLSRVTFLLLLGLRFLCLNAKALSSRDYAIEISATVQESPPRIILNWRNNGDGLQNLVQRKLKGASQWNTGVVLSASTTSYTDTNVAVGGSYEYSITKYPAPSSQRSGYIFAGIRAPLIESRGKVILLVDSTYASDLSSELNRLKQDLVADGWQVIRHDVARTASPPTVKNIIANDYWNDPGNTRTVFIFGHLAVPYSGSYNADDHFDHTGAWVADTYYADMDGWWSDDSANITSATRTENRNVPGDGKFDQTYIPSDLELEVGRVDFANLPTFSSKNERDLLRDYLNKDHNFRYGIITAQRRALLFDGFGESGGQAYAASGWRNFAPFFGSTPTELSWDQFFPTVGSQDYLWTYVAGGGDSNYMDCYGVGGTSNFAATNIKTIFMMIFGSYWGDWDAPNDFMRGALASGNALTAAWAGRPHWFFHHMALGETIGYSTRLTQNNNALYEPIDFSREVHVSLLGDPTLRMHPVLPPGSLNATTNAGRVVLNWSASADANLGYHIYRGSSTNGPFARLTTNAPVTTLSFTNDVSSGGTYSFMVRAVKLESSASGTYSNASEGIVIMATIPALPDTPVNISSIDRFNGQITFRCEGQPGQRFIIQRSTNLLQWTSVATNILNTSALTFTDSLFSPAQFYRTKTLP